MTQPDTRRAAPRQESGSQKIAATTSITTITALARESEQRRRVRLRRDLYRAAERLTAFDRPAAALARAWAREVA